MRFIQRAPKSSFIAIGLAAGVLGLAATSVAVAADASDAQKTAKTAKTANGSDMKNTGQSDNDKMGRMHGSQAPDKSKLPPWHQPRTPPALATIPRPTNDQTPSGIVSAGSS